MLAALACNYTNVLHPHRRNSANCLHAN